MADEDMEYTAILPNISEFLKLFQKEQDEKFQSGIMASKKILVVDDEKGIRDFFKDLLGTLVSFVACAENGKEAIERVQSEKFDVVFLDIKLPGLLNGVETFREIKKLQSTARVVLMTGYSLKREIEEGIQEGAHGILNKPFRDIKDIIAMIG